MFNLKKHSQKKETTSYPKRLVDQTEEMNFETPDDGATELQLKHRQHKDSDIIDITEKQLEEVQSGSGEVILEGALNKNPKVYNKKRDDLTHGRSIKSQDLVAEGYNQQKLEAYRSAEKGEDYNTKFWDSQVGAIDPPGTKITDNVQKSQLQTNPDRFDGLTPDIKGDVDKMVMASLNQADKMLFHIYATAAQAGRELSKNERQQITDINSGKARILVSQYQFSSDGEPYLPQEDEGEPYDDDETLQPSDKLFIDKRDFGRPVVVELEDGREVDSFNTLEEAKSSYPRAKERTHMTQWGLRTKFDIGKQQSTKGSAQIKESQSMYSDKERFISPERGLPGGGVIIRVLPDNSAYVYENEDIIDNFENWSEAKANYPEAEVLFDEKVNTRGMIP